jgi:hypothetical protein
MTKARTNADNASADIQGVTAGTGLTGGGTSGTVTLTNDMATVIAAKGDLVAGTANDTYAALGVGANNTVLTADSTAATGLKWAAANVFSGASVYKTGSAQNINNGTWTVLVFDSEYFDTDSYHSTSTNTGRFTVGTTGYYQIGAQCAWSANASGVRHHRIVKNGSTDIVYRVLGVATPSGSEVSFDINYLAYLTAGDYIEFQIYQDSGGTLTTDVNPNRTFFTIQKVG